MLLALQSLLDHKQKESTQDPECSKKNSISAFPLGKQFSHFTCPGQLLACLSYNDFVRWWLAWTLKVKSYLPSSKTYLSFLTGWDIFAKFKHHLNLWLNLFLIVLGSTQDSTLLVKRAGTASSQFRFFECVTTCLFISILFGSVPINFLHHNLNYSGCTIMCIAMDSFVGWDILIWSDPCTLYLTSGLYSSSFPL